MDAMTTASYDEYDYSNDTDDPCLYPALPYARWILPALYIVFFILGLIGNVLVIVVVSRRSSRRADTFILNLAVSDLLFVLSLPFWASALAMDGHWYFGVHLCRASSFIIAVTRCASSLLMAIMSVDRYLAVVGGQRLHPLRTRNCSLGACCTIWIVSIISGIPSPVFRHLDDSNPACVESSESDLSAGLNLATIMLTFVLPFIVVLFCYSCMAKHLWGYFGGQQKSSVGRIKLRRRHSWLRIVSCVVAAYSFSWFPYNTLRIVTLVAQLGTGLSCNVEASVNQALSATASLAFANSCTNPLIYALLDAGFRHRAQVSIQRFFPTCGAVLHLPFRGWSQQSTAPSTESSSSFTRTY